MRGELWGRPRGRLTTQGQQVWGQQGGCGPLSGPGAGCTDGHGERGAHDTGHHLRLDRRGQ